MSTVFSIKDAEGIKNFFDENGYVTISDLYTKEDVELLKQSFDEAVEVGNIKLDPEVLVECNDVVYRHPAFEGFANDKRNVQLVEDLFGKKGLELQHAKLNSKPMADKGKGVIEWHQDYPFFPHTNFDLLAFGIHMDDEDLDSGPLMVVPKSQKLGVLSHCTDNKFAYKCTDHIIEEMDPVAICCKAGYVTIHHCLTLHGSSQKRNTNSRRLLVYQYRTLDNVQLAGVIWKCTGNLVSSGEGKGFARFPDGTSVEVRGENGRLYDKFMKLAPDKLPATEMSKAEPVASPVNR